MTPGLTTFAALSHSTGGLLLAQFGGTKNFWMDIALVAVAFGGAVFVVCRSSRRY